MPSRTASDLLPETIARLAEMPELVGVKEATGSALRASQVIARVGHKIAVLSGDDATAFPLFALGGRGVISVVSNVAPALMSAMWDAAAAGDWNKARQLHYRLLPLGEGLFVEANPIPVKAALAMMGRMTEEIRPPLYPLAEPYRAKLRAQLDELGLLDGRSDGAAGSHRRPGRRRADGTRARPRRARRRRRARCWRRRRSAPGTSRSARTPACWRAPSAPAWRSPASCPPGAPPTSGSTSPPRA